MPCGKRYEGNGTTYRSIPYTQQSRPDPYSSLTTTSGEYTGSYLDTHQQSFSEGVCLENYHKRKATGELLPHTPYVFWEEEARYASGTGEVIFNDGWSYFKTTYPEGRAFYGGFNATVSPTHGEAADLATSFDYNVQKCAAKLYSDHRHDSLTFIAELSKTRDMVVDALNKVIQLRKRLFTPTVPKRRRRKLTGPANVIRQTKDNLRRAETVAGWWAEARYGWRPLIYDIQDINDALDHLHETKTRHVARSASNAEHLIKRDGSHKVTSCDYLDTQVDRIVVGTRGHIAADFAPPSRTQFNIPLTSWELVPWSFVVDWFVYVGQAIEAASFLTLADSYVASGGQYVRIERITTSEAVSWNEHYSGSMKTKTVGVVTWRKRTPVRVPISPQIKVRFNAFKLADLVSFAVTSEAPKLRRR